MTKSCSKCKKSKDVSLFYKSSAKPDGLTLYCKECSNKAQKKWANKMAALRKALQ